ncbi:MAG: 50S ribosomal protein L24 [Gammaproteobacteria bacterium CG_4_10_14_0_8_um_filter_38_16]|nr:MAG: 50S ribosomal protein L24 [Gammaproteobacteria bacterium CG_4_10_14_0_8_um_filter_38_16]PJA02904.1 MAG: 50S ribosomal protein L24 [Gammaproteobacteria bacterium CG_4_10_14_0_2_um_filter_38_22]PJB11429.1 MAG: 50S ribosomal protein L24 [Gammaproteobacteria bacterium CG_4_9_14_3_um_filter_38_9]
MNKIKKDDLVIVRTGKDKGRSGRVIKIVDEFFALVEGVGVINKHMKPNPHKNEQGGIVKKESPIRMSNLAILNPLTKKADRVGFKIIPGKNPGERARKARYFKSNNELVDVVG